MVNSLATTTEKLNVALQGVVVMFRMLARFLGFGQSMIFTSYKIQTLKCDKRHD
jgi:hypothetical protein